MYKKIVCKNLASVGYYIGGMSELELKTSEKKQLILASFSMSQEGLDIPTLNAEFLITPKTDIVQSVGRILRAKHKFSHPIIYDFIDTHDVFQRQWLKRKTFYKKQNYKIIGTNSAEYNTDMSKWKNIFEPKTNVKTKCVKTPSKKAVSEKSHSSTDKSITNDSDTEDDNNDDDTLEEQQNKQNCGKCLLTFKK
jgi:superfamily II DNA or RNA helicase